VKNKGDNYMEYPEIKFQFRSPKLIFGRNTYKQIPKICAQYGKKGIFVTGQNVKSNGIIFDEILSEFKANNMDCKIIIRESGEPTVTDVDSLAKHIKDNKINWILAIGGGSTMDLAKAASGLANNEGSSADYQKGKDVEKDGIPFIAVPTTAGTGSEITNNAVLINKKENVKLSIRGDTMIARVAIFDPVLTVSMAPKITAYTGMDALTQAIEAYVCKARNPLSDHFASLAIDLLYNNIFAVYINGNNIDAREKMLYGSLLSALAFSNAKLGAVHGFAHPIGVLHNLPHGLICGVLLPHVMKFNLEGNIPHVTQKFALVTKSMDPLLAKTSKSELDLAKISVDKTFDLLRKLNMPTTITGMGLKKSDIPAIVKDTKGSSLQNNPRDTTSELLTKILEDAL
jgi:alcohol dehydrogenase class IV